jgi:hypothetical protein
MSEFGKRANELLGTRDAVHVPFVVGRFQRSKEYIDLNPGQWVRFVDNEYTEFVLSDYQNGHGIIDPFLEKACIYESVRILLRPGITSPVRHTFEIAPAFHEVNKIKLEQELAQAQEDDPNCAGCWQIINNEITRM